MTRKELNGKQLKGFLESLKKLREAHKRGFNDAMEGKSRAYHVGAYNTTNHVLSMLGENKSETLTL